MRPRPNRDQRVQDQDRDQDQKAVMRPRPNREQRMQDQDRDRDQKLRDTRPRPVQSIQSCMKVTQTGVLLSWIIYSKYR